MLYSSLLTTYLHKQQTIASCSYVLKKPWKWMCDLTCEVSFFFLSVMTYRKKGREPNIEIQSFTICKGLGGGGEEGLQMVLGTFPISAGIPSHFNNLEMFTYKMWKHVAVSMCRCQCVWVSVCGQRGPSALVTLGIGAGGWGRYYQALISVVMMTSR